MRGETKKKILTVRAIAATVVIVGLCAAILGMDTAAKAASDQYHAETCAGWRQSVSELSGALSDLDLKLQKGLYASSDYQTVSWAAQVFAQAGQARAALEALPVYELRLSGTETFLNQVGEYTLESARRLLRGEELSETEKQTLRQMSLRAQELAANVGQLALRISEQNPDYEALSAWFRPSQEGAEKTDLELLEEVFSGDTALNYDGDHSAWYRNRASLLLSAAPQIPDLELRGIAARYLGCTVDLVQEGSSFDGTVAGMEFSNGENRVSVTARGGYLLLLSRIREIGDRTLGAEAALEAAVSGLEGYGYPGMEPVRWSVAGNVLTAVCAYRDGAVLRYGERITVSVAMDTGEVIGIDATEYLMIHRPETELPPLSDAETARQTLRSDLAVSAEDLVCLCCGDGREKYCWQFTVSDGNDPQVLVFVNAQTGVEEEIMILLESEEMRMAM